MYSYLTERKNKQQDSEQWGTNPKAREWWCVFQLYVFCGCAYIKNKTKNFTFWSLLLWKLYLYFHVIQCTAFVAVWEPSENCSSILPSSSAYHQNTCFLVGDVLEALCAFFCYLDKQMPLKTQCQQTCLWGGLWFQTHFERDKTRGKLPDSVRDH